MNLVLNKYFYFLDFDLQDEVQLDSDFRQKQREVWKLAVETYEWAIKKGVAKEQARAILPLSQYTEVYWTASFQAIMNFIELRNEKTAQWEIQEYAKMLLRLMSEIYPKTTKLWSEAHEWV